MVTVADGEQRPIRHGGGIKIFEIPGHIEDTPCPDRTKAQVVRDPAVSLGGTLSKGNTADDRPGQAEASQERHLEHHLVGGVPHLLVHVKRLGIEITHALHLPQVLKEVPEAGREILEIAVVHGHAHLVQEKGAFRLRPEGGEHVHRDNAHTRYAAVRHIGIYMVATAHIAEHLMYHIAGLPRPLLPKDEGELVRVVVLVGKVGQAHQHKKKDSN